MSTENQILTVLEDFSEQLWKANSRNIELSGWGENPGHITEKKSLLAEDTTRLKKLLTKELTNGLPLRYGIQRTESPLELKATSSLQKTTKRKIYKSPEKSFNKIAYFIKRREKVPNLEFTNNVRVTGMPLLKREPHIRHRSTGATRSKLKNYYDRNFLISQRSPPSVSGYSVTFYYKNKF